MLKIKQSFSTVDAKSTAVRKFSTTISLGSHRFRFTINVLTNTISNYIVHRRVAYHKGCMVTFHVPSHETHPGKALGKLIYGSSTEKYKKQCTRSRACDDAIYSLQHLHPPQTQKYIREMHCLDSDFHVYFSVDET